MKKATILIACMLGISSWANSQTADEILKKANSVLSEQNYKVDLLYASYDDHESSIATEKIKGSFKLFENGYVQKIDEVLVVQEDSLALNINHFHKEISLSKSTPLKASPLDFDLSDFSEYNISETVLKEANTIVVDLKINELYLEVSRIQFELEKDTYYPRKMTLFYTGNGPEDNKRLEVSFLNLSFNTIRSVDDQILSYVSLGQEDFTIISDPIKDYIKR